MRHSNIKSTVAGVVAGMGMGAGLALLFAPRSGARTRGLIAKKSREGMEAIKGQANALVDSGADMVEKGQQEAKRRKKELDRAVDIGKRAFKESVG